MHDDSVARALNFKSALVPGVTVFGFMTHALIDRFGDDWLDRGCMQVRFRQPVYADDVVSIRHRSAGSEINSTIISVEACNDAGAVCATGTGALGNHVVVTPTLQTGAIAPHRELPRPAWPAVRERFAAERVLGSIRVCCDAAQAAGFVTALQDDHAIYRNGITHPAWLLRQANIIVDRNFDLGPWIHVSSELQNFARVRHGDSVELRAQVVSLYERKGHEYAELDVVLLLDGDPERQAMRVLHRAIYRMGTSE
jgi:acyl dehydratase